MIGNINAVSTGNSLNFKANLVQHDRKTKEDNILMNIHSVRDALKVAGSDTFSKNNDSLKETFVKVQDCFKAIAPNRDYYLCIKNKLSTDSSLLELNITDDNEILYSGTITLAGGKNNHEYCDADLVGMLRKIYNDSEKTPAQIYHERRVDRFKSEMDSSKTMFPKQASSAEENLSILNILEGKSK